MHEDLKRSGTIKLEINGVVVLTRRFHKRSQLKTLMAATPDGMRYRFDTDGKNVVFVVRYDC